MFVAYSKERQRQVDVSEAYDLNEIFCCLDSTCSAEMRIRGVNSATSKHFAVVRGLTPHKHGCFYGSNFKVIVNDNNLIKSSLADILNGASRNAKNGGNAVVGNQNTHDIGVRDKRYIRTPKELLNFCLSNKLETEYADGITVNDIIVDSRNLANNGYFEGVTGIKLVLGHTVRYDISNNILCFETKTYLSEDSELKLKLRVNMHHANLLTLNKYIFGTYNGFSGNPVAVLGDWTSDETGCSECTSLSNRTVLFKFGKH
jgi:hypothetical protein